VGEDLIAMVCSKYRWDCTIFFRVSLNTTAHIRLF